MFGSVAAAAPISVRGGDDVGATGVAGAVGPPPLVLPVMPFSTQSINTTNDIRLKRVQSPTSNDFDEIFDTLPTNKKVRICAMCKHCALVHFGCSSIGTRHLLWHQKVCVSKTKQVALVQSHLQLKVDGTILTWEYKPDVAHKE